MLKQESANKQRASGCSALRWGVGMPRAEAVWHQVLKTKQGKVGQVWRRTCRLDGVCGSKALHMRMGVSGRAALRVSMIILRRGRV